MRRAGHRLLYIGCALALAACFVPAAVFCPPLGDWLAGCMEWNGERA